MTTTQELVGELLSTVIHNKRINRVPYDADWHEIFQLAVDHQIHSLLYTVVKEIPCEQGGPDHDLLAKWKEVSFVSAINEANRFENACSIISAFERLSKSACAPLGQYSTARGSSLACSTK